MRVALIDDYDSLNTLLDQIREFKLKHPEAMDNEIFVDYDYSTCYYESDLPTVQLVWRKKT